MSKLISVISICYNEELNIFKCYQKVKELFQINKLEYEHIFADNCSKDNTKKIIEDICAYDKNIKAIFNAKNYGPFVSNFNDIKIVGLSINVGNPRGFSREDLINLGKKIQNKI